MNSSDPVLFRELPLIQKIIQDETWLEGERRGCPVRPDDRVVRERVCEVILRVGHQIRESLTVSMISKCTPCGGQVGEGVTPISTSNANEAA